MSADLPPLPPLPPERVALVDLVDLPVGPPRWRYQALVIGLVVLLLGGVGVALLASNAGRSDADGALASVRSFIAEQRSATFTGTSEETIQPADGEVGTSETTRSRMHGEVRLPDQFHVVTDSGDWADETIVHGDDVYSRSADSVAGLASEKWLKWSAYGRSGPSPAPFADFPAAADAASFLGGLNAGAPLDLDALFDRLAKAEEVGPNRIRASIRVRELLPADVRRAIEGQAKQLKAFSRSMDDEEMPEGYIEGLDVSRADINAAFDTVLRVTVDYGPDGRLDALAFDGEFDLTDERSRFHEEYRFTGWGRPVRLTLPTAGQVDSTTSVDEEGLAQAAAQGVVAYAPAPAALPPGWGIGSAQAQEGEEELKVCPSVHVSFGPAHLDPETFDDEGHPPALDVGSVAASCQSAWADVEPPGGSVRTVPVGPWTAKVFMDRDRGGWTSMVLTVGPTTVVVSSTLPEPQLVAILQTLAPLDLAEHRVNGGGVIRLSD